MRVIIGFIIFHLNLCAGLAQFSNNGIVLNIEPELALFHKPLSIKASGLPPQQRVRLDLKANDAKGHAWESSAVYITDAAGKLNLDESIAVDGTYLGVQPMGLFWSMKSEDYHQIATHQGFEAEISLKVEGAVVATKTIYRKSTREFEDLEIAYYQKRDSIIADFYVPKSEVKLPAIIILGGSGGGFRQERSSLYASEGYAVLNLKYFRHESLPDGIIEIPLEYVAKAHQWLAAQAEIDPDRIGISGRSRGSELAMLYASKYDGLRYVIAEAPSSVVWFGWADGKSSWTYENQPFEYADYTEADATKIEQELEQQQLQYRDGPKFLSAFKYDEVIHNSTIKVEEIKCPILFVSGKEDLQWPATMMANRMVERLRANKFGHEFLHLSYEDAGHNFAGGGQGCGIPFLPPEDYSKKAAKGGTDRGNALAAIQSWPAILNFIQRHIQH